MSQRALLIVNPHSRRGDADRRQAVRQLQELGLTVIEESGEKPKQFPELIRHYQTQVDLVVIGGGDGSISAAVDGLLDTNLPLGILPLGTANNLARTLGISPSIAGACEAIALGHQRRIDIGWANGQYFFNIASLGLSALVNQRVPKQLKRHWGAIAYAVTALQVMKAARPFWADIYWDGQSVEARTLQITVANGRYYGSGISIAEDATIDDQMLDLQSIELQHWWEALPLIGQILCGKTIRSQRVRHIRSKDIEIHTRRPLTIHTDGERSTATPARFRIIPQALSVFAPPTAAI